MSVATELISSGTSAVLGVEMLAFSEIDDLSPDVKSRYLRRLFEAELDAGVPENRSHYRAYRRYKNSCTQVLDEVTGETCTKQRWQHHPHCLKHLSAEDLDTRSVNERRAEEARARMAEMLEVATDQLEAILRAPEDEIAPSVRLKALEMLYDRAGVPKRTQSDLDVRAEVTHHTDSLDVINARLEQLGEEFTPPESNHGKEEEEEEPPELVDAELVDVEIDDESENAA